ncbi:MAG: ribosomal-processing cysteine protease Prp [Exilispira sp.]
MINIQITRNSSSLIKLNIYGHSGIKGKSIPCAAVSYMIQSISNFCFTKSKKIYSDDGKIFIIDLIELKKLSNDLYEFLIFSLELISRDYPYDIKIEYLEENNGT